MASIEYDNPCYETNGTGIRCPKCETCKQSTGHVHCMECHEYFCKNCADFHKKLSLTKSHKVVKIKNMYEELGVEMEQLDQMVKDLRENAEKELSTLSTCGAGILKEMKKFRESINQFFDEKEKEFEKELKLFLENERRTLKADLVKCSSFQDEIETMKSNLHKPENENTDLSKYLKDIVHDVKLFHQTLESYVSTKLSSQYPFTKGTAYMKLLPSKNALGSIEKIAIQPITPLDITNTELARDAGKNIISTKMSEDRQACSIGSMAFLQDKLILLDRNNCSIKAVDTTSRSVTKHLKVSSEPFDVAPIGLEQVAVTMPMDQEIKILDTKGGLVPRGQLKVSGECLGIAATSDKLVVSFDASDSQGRIEILNHFGNVLKKVYSIKNPLHVCAGIERWQQNFFVFDSLQQTITMFSDISTGQGVGLCKKNIPHRTCQFGRWIIACL